MRGTGAQIWEGKAAWKSRHCRGIKSPILVHGHVSTDTDGYEGLGEAEGKVGSTGW